MQQRLWQINLGATWIYLVWGQVLFTRVGLGMHSPVKTRIYV